MEAKETKGSERKAAPGADPAPQLTATDVQLSQPVAKTPPEVLDRYRQNRNWKLYPKEWIYSQVRIAGQNILDFGAGTGEISTQLVLLGARRVFALDVTPGLLEITRSRAELDGVSDRVETICQPVQEVTIPPVDLIVSFAVLHHVHPIKTTVPHLIRLLKPGGCFVAVEPFSGADWLEWFRQRSGVPVQHLDEGEAKLSVSDFRYLCECFPKHRIVPFRLLGRLDKILPQWERTLSRIDRVLFRIPGTRRFAGQLMFVGTKPGPEM